MVQNYMETLVDSLLSSEFQSSPEKYAHVCKCPACIAFIKCTALNNLEPFYVTGLTGEVFGEYRHRSPQQTTAVLVAVGKGIEALEALGPRHGGDTQPTD